jgi:hypothetical protein
MTFWSLRRFSLPLVLVPLAACGGGSTEPVVPGGIVLNTTTVAFSSIGATQQLSAKVTDQNGATISSPTVTWSSSDNAVASVSGKGLVTSTGSGAAEITATAGSVSAMAVVTVQPYTIELMFLTVPTDGQKQAFVAAQQRWEGLVIGDVPDVQLKAAAGQCGVNSPAINRTEDDLLILVTLEAIDGPGNVLASSGPCFVRAGSRLPVLGVMRFDTADIDNLPPDVLTAVVTHEMGHVLGYGTIWTDLNLLADPSCTGDSTSNPVCSSSHDPHFTGGQALAAFDQAGGASYTASVKVPVENTGDVGTADAHWRETVFGNELMTGFVDQGFNPLSRVSVASMADLGYSVNFQGADDYTLPPPAAGATVRGPRIQLKNDRLLLPLHVVNAAGQVVRIVQP